MIFLLHLLIYYNTQIMKKYYLLSFVFILFFNTIHSQQSNDKDVHFNLSKVSKNITLGIKSYNVEDLKYHARISKKAIEIVERLVESEQCYTTQDLAGSIAIYLETALLAEELVTARTYLNKTEDLIIKAFYEYDTCSAAGGEDNNSNTAVDDTALTDLQKQQAELKAQQLALEQKAKAIKEQLAEQEEKESLLKKEQFIALNEKSITENIRVYNELLKACDCEASISNTSENISDMSTKKILQIRTHYLDKAIKISQNYITVLNDCKK